MPLFNWPYTNLHNLNLDWIIKKIKNVETAESNTAASEEAAAGSAASAAESEANAAASETNAAGSAAQAQQYYENITENVSTLVTGWMDEHITPTTPPVDDTLTIQGAAADAKKTGDEITDLKTGLNVVVKDQGIATDIAESSLFTKLAGTTANVSVSGITLTALSAYDTYYKVIEEDSDIWFDSNTSADYIAFCYGESYTGITANTIGCYNAVRKRSTEQNLPTEDAKITVPAGGVIAITVIADGTAEIYGVETEPTFSDGLILKIREVSKNPKSAVRYISGSDYDSSTEKIEIITPTSNGFIKYDFIHCVDATINCNIWRMGRVYALDDALNVITAITTSGEWETAIQLPDRPDFSGGYLHGDQVMTDIKFILDGVETQLISLANYKEFDQLTILQNSNLYDAIDSTTIISVMGSAHIFGSEGLNIKRSNKWVYSGAVSAYYLGMLPVAQNQSDKYYTDKDYTLGTTPAGMTVFNSRQITLYGTTNKITSQMIANIGMEKFSHMIETTNSGTLYHKVYFIRSAEDAVQNEIWQSDVSYKFMAS